MPRYYYRQSPHSGSGIWRGSVVKKIIIINVVVFLLQIVLSRTNFTGFFALYPRGVLTRGHVWQLVTYMFLHGNFFHIALNMFVVWMFGSPLEGTWGGDRFLKYYLICGIGGAVFSFIFSFNVPVIGASAAAYGLLLAYGVLFPYNMVYVWGLIPVRAKTLVTIMTFIELLYGISISDGIAHFAHLGGMAAGLIFLKGDYRAQRLWSWFGQLWRKIPIKIKIESADRDKGGEDDYDPGKIDSILDKISSKGYENLTETEKRILENYSEKKEKH